ncbi:hypothetical protein DL766_008040 [Monosporascus sp. MC13-8B]|uniref:Rieske domain-containing protein n=1 Tax=Monosporascus cannonballus TaxID=155416 RepID=A0ABY0H074_9PEZI|nr:hypothetical protein DL762_008599 [Monosporascus cannonballus]RYO88100.1 hypothetical protein DL763_006123 [Monosporascus cannonballus]RYP21026.1 hypothetical protein DL766_008040 [Monosporascus sp. MC13-8B]
MTATTIITMTIFITITTTTVAATATMMWKGIWTTYQLSSRPGSVVLANGEVPYKEETGKRQAYPDGELTSQYGSSHRSMRDVDAREMGYRHEQPVFYVPDDKGRRWELDMAKEADAPYMIPKAGVGTHPKRCPYHGRVYELD